MVALKRTDCLISHYMIYFFLTAAFLAAGYLAGFLAAFLVAGFLAAVFLTTFVAGFLMILVFLLSRAAFPANSRFSASTYSMTAASRLGHPDTVFVRL